MDICYPPDTDWSATYATPEDLAAARTPERQAMFEMAEAYAWSVLAALTNYRIGTCPVTVRPCAARCAPEGSWNPALVGSGHSAALGPRIGQFSPYVTGGVWVNAYGCRRGCECSSISQVILPGPVGAIVEVRVDGAVLPRTAYRVYNGSRLVRMDGGSWPVCADLAAPDNKAFEVTYYRGAAPNAMTKFAAGVLANEFLLGFEGKDGCRLPMNVTAMSRAGESYEFTSAETEGIAAAIPEVSMLVNIYNPHGLRAPVIVASPDTYDTPVATWR